MVLQNHKRSKTVGFLFTGIFLFLFSLFQSSKAEAYTFKRDISTTVTVIAATEVKVVQKQSLSWDNPSFFFPANRNYLYAYAFPAFSSQEAGIAGHVRNISVTNSYASGNKLSFTKSVSAGALQIKVPYYENLSYDNDLDFTISYTTDLYATKEGGLLEIAYPGLSDKFSTLVHNKSDGYDERTSYSLTFVVPSSMGTISSFAPASGAQATKGKNNTISFGTNSLIGNSVRITVGDQRLIKFTLTGKTYSTINNSPDFVKNLLLNYIDVALPTQQAGTEFANQIVYYTKIEPFPTKIWTDSDGNVIARIPVSAASDGNITIEGYAILRGEKLPSTLSKAKISDISVSEMSQYLAGEPRYWQVTDPTIQKAAAGQKDSSGLEYASVRKTLQYVAKTLAYAKVTSETQLQRLGAVRALSSKVGVCMEYADLTLSILRAESIPARAVFGDGVGNRVDRTLEGIGHQWVGVWFPEAGWISIDPTWSNNGREYIGYDFDHFVWYVASKSVDEPSGFNCLSWDSQSPCRDALKIDTTPVNELPAGDVMFTIQDVKARITATNSNNTNIVTKTLQQVVSYLGSSQLGRVLLSRQGMLILFAAFLYLLLVLIVSVVTKTVRKRKAIPATEQKK